MDALPIPAAAAGDEAIEVTRSPRLTHRPMVYQAPEFSRRLNPLQEIKTGDTVIFECQFKAFPQPTVKWFKDDQEIATTDGRTRLDVDDSEGLLRLTVSAVAKSDEGAYKCKVENQEGVATTTGYLSVTGDSSPKTSTSGNNGQQTSGNKSPEPRSVSLPPLLRTIIEQKSLEEREAHEHLGEPGSHPSPFQPLFDGRRTWPLLQMGYGPGWTDERTNDVDAHSSGSDTSIGSQELDFGSFALDGEPGPELVVGEGDSDLRYDDLDDDVFRKEPNVSILSSVPLNFDDFKEDDNRDLVASTASSDLFILEGDDSLSEYSNLSRDLDSGVLSLSPENIPSSLPVEAQTATMIEELSRAKNDDTAKSANVHNDASSNMATSLLPDVIADRKMTLAEKSTISEYENTKATTVAAIQEKLLPEPKRRPVSVGLPPNSLYTQETAKLLTSDLMSVLILLVSTGTFLGTSLGISPTYYVLLLSLVSLVCFRVFSAQ